MYSHCVPLGGIMVLNDKYVDWDILKLGKWCSKTSFYSLNNKRNTKLSTGSIFEMKSSVLFPPFTVFSNTDLFTEEKMEDVLV